MSDLNIDSNTFDRVGYEVDRIDEQIQNHSTQTRGLTKNNASSYLRLRREDRRYGIPRHSRLLSQSYHHEKDNCIRTYAQKSSITVKQKSRNNLLPLSRVNSPDSNPFAADNSSSLVPNDSIHHYYQDANDNRNHTREMMQNSTHNSNFQTQKSLKGVTNCHSSKHKVLELARKRSPVSTARPKKNVSINHHIHRSKSKSSTKTKREPEPIVLTDSDSDIETVSKAQEPVINRQRETSDEHISISSTNTSLVREHSVGFDVTLAIFDGEVSMAHTIQLDSHHLSLQPGNSNVTVNSPCTSIYNWKWNEMYRVYVIKDAYDSTQTDLLTVHNERPPEHQLPVLIDQIHRIQGLSNDRIGNIVLLIQLRSHQSNEYATQLASQAIGPRQLYLNQFVAIHLDKTVDFSLLVDTLSSIDALSSSVAYLENLCHPLADDLIEHAQRLWRIQYEIILDFAFQQTVKPPSCDWPLYKHQCFTDSSNIATTQATVNNMSSGNQSRGSSRRNRRCPRVNYHAVENPDSTDGDLNRYTIYALPRTIAKQRALIFPQSSIPIELKALDESISPRSTCNVTPNENMNDKEDSDSMSKTQSVQSSTTKSENKRIHTGRISLTFGDIDRLRYGEFLNDSLISWWLEYRKLRLLSPWLRDRIHIVSSFFFERLAQSQRRGTPWQRAYIAYESVKRWTQNVDIFSRQMVFIPINRTTHWSLAIIIHPYSYAKRLEQRLRSVFDLGAVKSSRANAIESSCQSNVTSRDCHVNSEMDISSKSRFIRSTGYLPDIELDSMYNEAFTQGLGETEQVPCIVFMDSLKAHSLQNISLLLRRWLTFEWLERISGLDERPELKHLSRSEIASKLSPTPSLLPEIEPSVPEQLNHCDCGVFVLRYAELVMTLLKHGRMEYLSAQDVREKLVGILAIPGSELFTAESVLVLRQRMYDVLHAMFMDRIFAYTVSHPILACSDATLHSELLDANESANQTAELIRFYQLRANHLDGQALDINVPHRPRHGLHADRISNTKETDNAETLDVSTPESHNIAAETSDVTTPESHNVALKSNSINAKKDVDNVDMTVDKPSYASNTPIQNDSQSSCIPKTNLASNSNTDKNTLTKHLIHDAPISVSSQSQSPCDQTPTRQGKDFKMIELDEEQHQQDKNSAAHSPVDTAQNLLDDDNNVKTNSIWWTPRHSSSYQHSNNANDQHSQHKANSGDSSNQKHGTDSNQTKKTDQQTELCRQSVINQTNKRKRVSSKHGLSSLIRKRSLFLPRSPMLSKRWEKK